VTERGDLTKKKLFGIVSNQPGEHDTAIPTEFFETPPDDALKDSSRVARALRVSGDCFTENIALTVSSSNTSQCYVTAE
jgi:hypothetical protein